jgi:hypothetical protein
MSKKITIDREKLSNLMHRQESDGVPTWVDISFLGETLYLLDKRCDSLEKQIKKPSKKKPLKKRSS